MLAHRIKHFFAEWLKSFEDRVELTLIWILKHQPCPSGEEASASRSHFPSKLQEPIFGGSGFPKEPRP
jgi:hypothetical protein